MVTRPPIQRSWRPRRRIRRRARRFAAGRIELRGRSISRSSARGHTRPTCSSSTSRPVGENDHHIQDARFYAADRDAGIASTPPVPRRHYYLDSGSHYRSEDVTLDVSRWRCGRTVDGRPVDPPHPDREAGYGVADAATRMPLAGSARSVPIRRARGRAHGARVDDDSTIWPTSSTGCDETHSHEFSRFPERRRAR